MSDLIVPVYLNQRIVFDLIAIIEDGIATVTRLTSTEERLAQEQRAIGGAFGLSAVLSSLLRISVDARRAETSERGSASSRNEEKVHTPTSLLHKLIEKLRASNELQKVEAGYDPVPGHIIQFVTTLQRNPLLRTLDAFDGLMEVWHAFADPEPPNRKKGAAPRQLGAGNDVQYSRSEVKRLREQMSTFAAGVRAGDTVDMVSSDIGNGYGAVLPLHQEYLNDPTMADLVDGEFTVVGKVIRVIDSKEEGVNLLRKSPLSAMSEETLLAALSSLENVENFEFPRIKLQVPGPVVQVIPISIYA